MKAANTMQVRQHNKTVIRQAMLCLRQATRPQLAQKTGLSQVTVSSVLAELMEKGEVESCGSVPSEGGRPSACYRYRGERHNAGVLYTYQMEGRTLVHLEVFDLFGDRVDRASQFLGDLRPESFDALLDAAFQETPGIRTLHSACRARWREKRFSSATTAPWRGILCPGDGKGAIMCRCCWKTISTLLCWDMSRGFLVR